MIRMHDGLRALVSAPGGRSVHQPDNPLRAGQRSVHEPGRPLRAGYLLFLALLLPDLLSDGVSSAGAVQA